MVNIKLDSEWSLTSDSKQYILNKDERTMTFHNSLASAIESYFQMKIRNSQARTISGLYEYHKRLLHALNQALTPFEIQVKPIEKEPVVCSNVSAGLNSKQLKLVVAR